MDILSVTGTVLFSSALSTLKDVLIEAVKKRADLRGANLGGADLREANLRGANLYGAYLRGANLYGKKVHSIKVFAGLYQYQVWAVLFADGTRSVRMGCLFYALDKWEEIGIRKSNLSEFPDDRSDRCEERVAAFEFAKAAALRMALTVEEIPEVTA